MHQFHRLKRPGIARIELVLLFAISLVIIGIGFQVLNRVHETNARNQCADRLRAIGRACNDFERDRGYLPADDLANGRTFLWEIREYFAVRDVPPDSTSPAVSHFLCPSRRTVPDLRQSIGPSDYGCAKHPGKYRSILAGPRHVITVNIAITGGTSNKIMVGHLGVRPSDYKLGVESGQSSWVSGPLSRDPSQFVRDDDELPMNSLLGSAHPGAAPFLFADGAVRRIAYSPELTSDQWKTYWGYNDRVTIPNQYVPE